LQVVSDVAASVEELSNTFVKEGFEEFGCGSKGGRKDDLMGAVECQEKMLGEVQKELYELKANMSDRKKQGYDKVEDNYYEWDECSVADIGEEKFREILNIILVTLMNINLGILMKVILASGPQMCIHLIPPSACILVIFVLLAKVVFLVTMVILLRH